MAPLALAALLAVALPTAASAAKDANTIVYAAFGDWGWPLQGAFRARSNRPTPFLAVGTPKERAPLGRAPPSHAPRPHCLQALITLS
jgi:hypothetical protein